MVKDGRVEVAGIKSSDAQAAAVFSRSGAVDHDGDITVPGAIRDGTTVIVSPYNHSSVIGRPLADRPDPYPHRRKAIA